MSQKLYLYVPFETKPKWKERIAGLNKVLQGFASFQDIEKIKLFPGWKLAVYELDIESADNDKIRLCLEKIEEAGYFGSYLRRLSSGGGEEKVYRVLDGTEQVYANAIEALDLFFTGEIGKDHVFFKTTAGDEKILVKVKPKNKKLLGKLRTAAEKYVQSHDNDSLNALRQLVEEQDVEHNGVFASSPEGLLESLCYVKELDGTVYLGFVHDGLSRYLSEDVNIGASLDSPNISFFVEGLSYFGTGTAAKARCPRLDERGLEGYIFNFGGVFYFKEQQRIPEVLWGESDIDEGKKLCPCGSGRRYENCHGIKK